MLGDERRRDERIARSSGDGHGTLVFGEDGDGLTAGGFSGMDGRMSLAAPGGIRRGLMLSAALVAASDLARVGIGMLVAALGRLRAASA